MKFHQLKSGFCRPRKDDTDNLVRAAPQDGHGTRVQCVSGSGHIIHQKNGPAGYPAVVFEPKRTPYVSLSFVPVEARLGERGSYPPKRQKIKFGREFTCHMLREKFALVEAALPEPLGMKGNGHYERVFLPESMGPGKGTQKGPQKAGQTAFPPVFETVYNGLKGTFVEVRGFNSVEQGSFSKA